MKKSLTLLVMVLLCACSQNDEIVISDTKFNQEISAKSSNPYYVTIDEAQEKLENILNDLNANPKTRAYSHTINSITNRFTTGNISASRSEDSDDVSVHVFNFGEDDGFAIMSTDSRTVPLLALTTDGKLNPYMEDDGSNLVGILASIELHYKDELKWRKFIQEDPMKPIFVHDKTEYSYFPNENGMCEVKWGQGKPYNDECPFVQENVRGLTGCVTTAVAQLMSIYEYPQSYKGINYDWDAIKKSYYSYDGGRAYLMAQLGYPENLNVSYGVNSSGADPANIPRTLEHFGYTCGGQLKEYKDGEIISELEHGYPVLIGGHAYINHSSVSVLGITIYSNTWYSEGHRWLGHGLLRVDYIKEYGYTSNQEIYKTDCESHYYILCNLGWNGYNDGFYYSGQFDTNEGPKYSAKKKVLQENGEEVQETEGTSGNFQYNLNVVLGIRQ